MVSIKSVLDAVGTRLTQYAAMDAKKDVERAEKYDFKTCNALTNGDNAATKYRVGEFATVDRFVQAFPALGNALKNSRTAMRALSWIPATMFELAGAKKAEPAPRETRTIGTWTFEKVDGKWRFADGPRVQEVVSVPGQEAVKEIAMKKILTDKQEELGKLFASQGATVGSILHALVAPPADASKHNDYLTTLGIAAGGWHTPEILDLNKFEAVKVNDIIKPAEALIVSAAYYMAAGSLVSKCEENGRMSYTNEGKAKEYIEMAQKWETIARRSFSPELAQEFEARVRDFDAAVTNARDPQDKIQRARAHFTGWFESGKLSFRDETYTKIHRDTVSPMVCMQDANKVNDDATYHFSTFRDPIVALWWQARHGALGCFGDIKIGGGGTITPVDCDPGYRAVGRRCIKIYCGPGSVPYKKCDGPPPDGGGGFGTQPND